MNRSRREAVAASPPQHQPWDCSLASRPCTVWLSRSCARAPPVNRTDLLDAEPGEGAAHLGEPRGRRGRPHRGREPPARRIGGEGDRLAGGGEPLPAPIAPEEQVADVLAVLGSVSALGAGKIGAD
jgi:hypothetical protein